MAKKISPEIVQQVLAGLEASGLVVKPVPFEKMDKAREEMGLEPLETKRIAKSIAKAAKKGHKVHVSKTRLTQLAQAREAYFRKMGFGKFRKEKKQAIKKAAAETAKTQTVKSKGKKAQVTTLAAARDAYFRKMGYGKYRKAS